MVKGVYYYRLAQIDLDGQFHYGKTISCTASGRTVRLYPNPVEGHAVMVSLSDAPAVLIYNSIGKTMFDKKLPAGDSRLDLSNFLPGAYFLKAGEQKISFVVR